MKGDFTRNTFKPQKHYQQVLMRQGRVQLDADWNEQAKGNFIWAHGERGEERLYLDGETFRLPTGINGNDVKLPSGDNRRGGDFEMWFWLVQDFVQ